MRNDFAVIQAIVTELVATLFLQKSIFFANSRKPYRKFFGLAGD